MTRILMCPPDFYGIEYEINPWMNTQRQADHALAMRQWQDLRDTLETVGARIELQQPVPGLPDMVFTANAGLIHGNTVIVSRFRHPQRQGEEVHDRHWFENQGFDVKQLPEDMYFEGAGDALFCGDTLFAGYLIRSDASSQQAVGKLLGTRIIPMELVDAYYYHLDTCFCPLGDDVALYYPPAFDEYARQVLQQHIPMLIAVEPDEARSFACNAVVVGNSVVTNTGCPHLHDQLRAVGFSPHATSLSEFVKSGGSAKCLTLRLE